MQNVPEFATALVVRASRAAQERRFPEALRLWSLARQEDPTNRRAILGTVRALLALDRAGEAESIAAEIEQVPATAVLAPAVRARIAQSRREWPRALEQWRLVRERLPDDPSGLVGIATALCQLGRFDEADRELQAAANTVAAHPEMEACYCRVAEFRRDWRQALGRWNAARDRRPGNAEAHIGVVRALLSLGRMAEAEAAAEAAKAQFPGHLDVHAIHAECAHWRGDWALASRRWDDVELRFAGNPLVRAMRRASVERVNENAERQSAVVAAAGETERGATEAVAAERPDRTDPKAMQQFFMQFESLGRNCEFGLLQRQFGAEPLGLLRWSATPVQPLITALSQRFRGVGDPDQTELEVKAGEYRIRDTLYRFAIHTRIMVGEGDPEIIYRKQCPRIRFLRDKLLGDLETESKILVFQLDHMQDTVIRRLYETLGEYGRNVLLAVKLADAGHPAGLIEIEDRLVIASIDRLGSAEPGHGWDISVEHWISFCEAAYRVRRAIAVPDASLPETAGLVS